MKKVADKKLVIGGQFHIFQGFHVITISLVSRYTAGRVMGTENIPLGFQPDYLIPYSGRTNIQTAIFQYGR
jgi:hypothetical protein